MMKRILLLAVASAALCGADGAEIETLRNYTVEDVVVTATRTAIPLKNAPVITRVIEVAEIEKSGVATLESLLERELAGVEFHQAGYGTTLSFQGLDARYVLFLVDGERLAGETYGNIDYGRIPLSNIRRVEIIRGASSVLYGSNAMGAVVNVITRMPQEKVEVRGSVRYGTRFDKNSDETTGTAWSRNEIDTYHDKLDLPNLSADLSVGINAGEVRSLTAMSYRTTDAYKLVGRKNEERHYAPGQWHQMAPKMQNGRPVMDPATGAPVFEIGRSNVGDTTLMIGPDARGLGVSGAKNVGFTQKLEWEPSARFRFEATAGFYAKERYDFLTSIMDDNPMSQYTSSRKKWAYESYEGYNGKFLMEHTPNDRSKVYISVAADVYLRSLDSLSGVSTPKQRHSYITPRFLWTVRAGDNHRITSGVEMTSERLRFDLNPAGYNDEKSLNTFSLYLQDEILHGRQLSFMAGVRGDYNSRFDLRVTPTVSAKYSPGVFTLRANYSSGYRLPSLKEMYMDFTVPVASAQRILGNENLKPETNHYVSASGELSIDGLYLSATVGKSFFRNKIDVRSRDENGVTIMQYDNIRRSDYSSVELVGKIRIVEGMFLSADYNYIFESDDTSGESTQYIFPSAHTATFALDYRFSAGTVGMGVNARVRYVGPKHYEDFMPFIDMSGGMMSAQYWTGTYTARAKGYALCNLAVSADFQRNISLVAGVDNLLDYRPDVVSFNSALTPGFNGFVKLAFDF